jgi:ABC-type lipoprotein export system ATPase subunit
MPKPLKAIDVHKSFETESDSVEVLRGVSFAIEDGESVAITGPSGSGKSTLLHLIGALDTPTRGRVEVTGREAYRLPEGELARFRNETIGFVFQSHHLLPQYSALENVLIPALAFSGSKAAARKRAEELIDRVGLGDRASHRPAEMSGGERQRVAVARALINQPKVLLCDEPTGSLDSASADNVADLLFELHAESETILVVVTHSESLAARCRRRLELREGTCSER